MDLGATADEPVDWRGGNMRKLQSDAFQVLVSFVKSVESFVRVWAVRWETGSERR